MGNMTKRLVAAIAVALCVAFASLQLAYADADSLTASGSVLVQTQASVKTQASAKWKTISSPEQLRKLHFKSEGLGPGYYKIGADFTLGDDCYSEDRLATCALLSGSYVIDFNGHTVQSAGETLATFTVQGANVTFLDSKASSNKASISSYGVGCIEARTGSVTILNGNYACRKFTNAGGSAVYVGSGATCTINGGMFSGTYCALANSGGALTVQGGSFYGGYPYAYLHMAGTTKLVRGSFYGSKTYQGYYGALGALSYGNAVNFDTLLASGSSWETEFSTYYYNGQSSASLYPSALLPYAASYAQTVTVNGSVGEQQSGAVPAPAFKSLKPGKKKIKAKWGKVSGATKYQLRYSKKKGMNGAKVLDVTGKGASKTLKKLKSKKTYYVQVRAFQEIEGLTYYSPWSAKKNVKTK